MEVEKCKESGMKTCNDKNKGNEEEDHEVNHRNCGVLSENVDGQKV